jgi:hypothetical protein
MDVLGSFQAMTLQRILRWPAWWIVAIVIGFGASSLARC